jgi:hypothetical protein
MKCRVGILQEPRAPRPERQENREDKCVVRSGLGSRKDDLFSECDVVVRVD